MLTAVLVVFGAVVAWLLIDRLLLRRDERLHRGHAAWTEPNRTFHSTGWEETLSPLEVSEPLRQRARDRTGA